MLDKLFHFFLSFVVIVGLCTPFMTKDIKIRPIIQLIVLEVVAAFALLHTSVGLGFVQGFAGFFGHLLIYAGDGVKFVFGGFGDTAFFFCKVLLPIVFISALIGILRWIRVLPFIIKWVGWALSKVNGMPQLESFNAVSSMIVGQSENFIAIKNVLPHMSVRRMYALSATAMSTVSMSIVGAYMTMLKPEYVVAALLLNMLSTFVILHLINAGDDEEAFVSEESAHKQNFFEMLGEYILDGFKVAVIVAAMLIGFIAIISGLNAVFDMAFGVTFQHVLGFVFYPIAWVLGVPSNEALQVGSLMATKLVSNEFVAMLDLGKMHLTDRSLGIISVFLVSFANFSSIGIIAGAVKALNEEQGNNVSRFGLKLVYGATLVSILSAAVAALVI